MATIPSVPALTLIADALVTNNENPSANYNGCISGSGRALVVFAAVGGCHAIVWTRVAADADERNKHRSAGIL